MQPDLVDGLPDLVPRLAGEVEASVPDGRAAGGADAMLGELDDGGRGVCHFDFHPSNVLVGPDGWVVIDWLTVAAGPRPPTWHARCSCGDSVSAGPVGSFLRAVRREGQAQRNLPDDVLEAWVRVVAAARVAEGFEGEERAWLLRVASGAETLPR